MSDDPTESSKFEIDKIAANESQPSIYLQWLSGKNVGRLVRLEAGDVVLGRSASADLQIEEDDISRKHALISVASNGDVTITDLGSMNGTHVNGVTSKQTKLRDGDNVQLGAKTVFKLTYQNALEEEVQNRLYESATKDSLTGIYNKRFFLERLNQEFSYCSRHEVALSLIVFDVDSFKQVNDTYGHRGGDHVLEAVAQAVLKAIRTEDILCRVGGDEFAIIVRDLSELPVKRAAERARAAVAQQLISFQKNHIPVTISVGCATITPGNFGSTEELLAAADRYLYAAKKQGKNRVEGPVAQAM